MYLSSPVRSPSRALTIALLSFSMFTDETDNDGARRFENDRGHAEGRTHGYADRNTRAVYRDLQRAFYIRVERRRWVIYV